MSRLNFVHVSVCFQVDFWSYPVLGLPTDIMMAPDAVIKAKKVLDDAGIEYQISTSDVQRYLTLQ